MSADFPIRKHWRKGMRWTSILLFLSGMILFFDLGGELHAFISYPDSVSGQMLLHLAAEITATLGLGMAFALIRADLRRSKADQQADRERLSAIRADFDRMMRRRFTDWGLSPAERDVALLTVRGLKIADIAEMRGAHQGTIKSQLSTIFRKSGVSNRTEFVASFIDELLDLAASDASAPNQPPPDPSVLQR